MMNETQTNPLVQRGGINIEPTAIRDFCKRWRIREMSLFGSILRNDFGPQSDVDVLIDHDDDAEWDLIDHFHMQDELESLFDRRVDLVDKRAIERSDNRFIKKAVLTSAKTIYAAR